MTPLSKRLVFTGRSTWKAGRSLARMTELRNQATLAFNRKRPSEVSAAAEDGTPY